MIGSDEKEICMKKVLIVATVGRFLGFEKNDISILKSKGYEVHCAANWSLNELDQMPDLDVEKHQVDFARSPFSSTNLKAYCQLKRIIRDGSFEFVHCHTPVGALLTRIASRKFRRKGLRVIYTAHGFHFFKGASWKNWVLFYPMEWLCSWWTDVLITINREDYSCAKQHLHAGRVEYLHGVGIDLTRFGNFDSDIVQKKREELGISDRDVLFLSVGELSRRKNHQVVLDALACLQAPNIRYVICGEGELREELEKQIERLHLTGKVQLLGHRQDVAELCQAADAFIFPSRQEGLPVALMEAIASRTPVFCSEIRGSTDLVTNTDCMFEPMDSMQLLKCIKEKLGLNRKEPDESMNLRKQLEDNMAAEVEQNFQRLSNYDINKVRLQMEEIYDFVSKTRC